MDLTRSVLARNSVVVLAILVSLGGNLCRAAQRDDPWDHIYQADEQLDHCNPAGAIVEYNLAVRLKPRLKKIVSDKLALSHFMLAERLARQKDFPRALAELDQALELEPKEAYWHLAKALLQAKAGDLASAQSECGRALQLEKKDPGLAETCKDPGQTFEYAFIKDVIGPAADSFAKLAALKSDATSSPVALHVPIYGNELPGSMVAMVATIGIDGKVSKMQIVKPMGMGLDREALKIMRKSRFKPAMRNGAPVETRSLVTILFGMPCNK